jgi:hypothetical protein
MRKNGFLVGLIGEKSTEGLVTPHRESPAHGQEINQKNENSPWHYQLINKKCDGGLVILPGITSSWMKNPMERDISAGDFHIMDADSGEQQQNA